MAAALNAGTPIIITTLQKFSFILTSSRGDARASLRRHRGRGPRSQTGESATNLKKVLGTLEQAEKEEGRDEDKKDEIEDEILKAIRAGPQPNLSFFAFTATPKTKTLEMFGTPGPDGKPRAFHLYSMRQAIEEGFILDVLKNYTTYATYYRFEKAVEDDPDVDKRRQSGRLPDSLASTRTTSPRRPRSWSSTFRPTPDTRSAGKAKAMVVTALAAPCRPLQASLRPIHREEGLHGHRASWSRFPAPWSMRATSTPKRG